MELRVGDKVKIKGDLIEKVDNELLDIVEDMLRYQNKIATITEIVGDKSVYIDLDEGHWFWHKELLEKQEPAKYINVDDIDFGIPKQLIEVGEIKIENFPLNRGSWIVNEDGVQQKNIPVAYSNGFLMIYKNMHRVSEINRIFQNERYIIIETEKELYEIELENLDDNLISEIMNLFGKIGREL